MIVLLSVGCGKLNSSGAGADPDSDFVFGSPVIFSPVNPSGVGSASDVLVAPLTTNESFADLLLLTSNSGTIYFQNSEGDGFSNGQRLPVSPLSYALAALTNDSRIVVSEPTSGSLRLMTLNETTPPSLASGFFLARASTPVVSMAVAGKHVMVITNPGTSFLTEIGAANFVSTTPVADFNGVDARVISGLINSDSSQDLVVLPRIASAQPTFYRGSSTLAPQKVAGAVFSRTATTVPQDFQLVQLSGTTAVDLILASATSFELYENRSTVDDFEFARVNDLVVPVGAERFVFADFINQDGTLDLVLVRNGESARLFRQTSSLEFEEVITNGFQTGTTEENPLELKAVDLNGDAKMDLVQVYADGTISVHINNGITLE
jgi:hypothetical protein